MIHFLGSMLVLTVIEKKKAALKNHSFLQS